MKKILLSLSFIIISSVLFLGCNNTKKTDNNQQSTSSEQIIDKSDNKVNTQPSQNKNKSNNVNSNNNSSNINKKNSSLLTKIKSSAEKGIVINSNFKIGESIDTVISKLGKANSEDFVPDAKGTYFTFNSYNLAFGCNKGSQIFEIRSFDKTLNTLNSKLIKNFFGDPDYNKTLKKNEIIYGYKINSEYKILFVFNSNGELKHYSVLKPTLTKNSMANDSGRNW